MNSYSYTDNQLLEMLLRGEQQAFNEIYNRYWDKLLAIAFNHTQDQSTAEDIVQNIFVGLWQRKDELKIVHLEHYLAKAVKFAVFKEYYRKQKRDTKLKKEWSIEEEENLEDQINAKFLQEYIDGIVEKLPQKCRLIFKFSRRKHWDNMQIANKLNIAPKTVEAHITKALKTIRKELNESGILMILFLSFLIFSFLS